MSDAAEEEVAVEEAKSRGWAGLADAATELRAAGLWRELRCIDRREPDALTVEGGLLRGFAANDYLGLAVEPAVTAAVEEGVRRWGAGAGASRLVCGTYAPHVELERLLAEAKGAESALTFANGFSVPLGVVPALVGPGDTVILDKLCHACLVDAAKLSGATLRVFPHNHLDKLERLLQGARGRVLVITESVFSMDGDRALLPEVVELKDRHGAWLLLDEAHALGVIGPQGRGLAAEWGLEERVELKMGTLSKAVGLSGGYVAGRRVVMDWLVNRARSFIYSTAPPPFLAHAAQVAMKLLMGGEGDQRRTRLRAHTALLRERLGIPEAVFSSAIVPVMIGDEKQALAASGALREAGFWVPAIRYPTVARGRARLRVTLSAAQEDAHVEAFVLRLREILRGAGLELPDRVRW